MTIAGLTVTSRWAFVALVAVVALSRLVELRLAKRHVARLVARGGFEVGAGHYPWMVALHTAFLFAAPLEVFVVPHPFRPAWAVAGITALLAAAALRWWTIRTLGDRWTTRVIVVPGASAIRGGPFRFFRHPNYLAVVLEIAALPLVHGAVVTAAVFSLANAVLLRHRIRVEETALRAHGDYGRAFDGVATFPGATP